MNRYEFRFTFTDKNGDSHNRIWVFHAETQEKAEKKFDRSLNSQAKKTLRDLKIELKNTNEEV